MKRTEQNAIRWFVLVLVTTVFVVLTVATIWFLTVRPEDPKVIPADSADFQQNPALRFAFAQYRDRGATYVWGPNDCSVFVTDYLKGIGAPVKQRLTTALLADPSQLRPLGFTVQTTSPGPGDILVYRYRNGLGQMRGHCGIVVEREDGLWVAHNTQSHGGVVLETLDSFRASANSLSPEVFRCFRQT